MNTKFTPGPWICHLVQKWPFGVEVVSETGRFILRESAIYHSTVQKARADNETGMGFKQNSDEAAAAIAEQDANARLIAAAPVHHTVAMELDRLCLVIESAVRNADPSSYDEVLDLIRSNRAAIAAATGDNS